MTDPRTFRLSQNFVLSDFLGNHSVYSKGFANPFDFSDDSASLKLDNVRCLCQEALEPLLQEYGPMTVSYGYISPELSRRIVKYQDPNIPSHHRFDLGAAADICVHEWVRGEFVTIEDLVLPESAIGSPIALAHLIDYVDIPYSRLITYSESPYVCVAVSAAEYVRDKPRKAFYENRYEGKPKVKPGYLQYATYQAKVRALERLQNEGLEHDWQGAGHPTYHGGGFRQYQHMRVSRYTMVSDWLFDLQSISNGAKNVPALNLDSVQDALAAAGLVYDWMIDTLEVKRLSIVGGYVSPTNPYFNPENDWRGLVISFSVNPPEGYDPVGIAAVLNRKSNGPTRFEPNGFFVIATVFVDNVLDGTV